jgi:hypothetical protein
MRWMKVITLRNIPPAVARLIEERSARTGMSLNKTVIRLLEERLGVTGPAAGAESYRDLDDLAGVWSDEDAREFDRILEEQRRIDPELWE